MRPQELVERGPGAARARPRDRHRRAQHDGEPAVGQLDADHQRDDRTADGSTSWRIPRSPGGIGSGTTSAVVRTPTTSRPSSRRPAPRPLGAGPAQDAAPEVPARPASPTWDLAPALSAPEELAPVSALLSEVLPATDIDHFGYAEHTLTSSYLGTTSGLRLRHDQPAARFELCGKSASRQPLGVGGPVGTLLRARWTSPARPPRCAADWRPRPRRIDVAPGRQRVLLSPSAAADMLIYLLWSAGARDAVEGRSAFSRHGGGTRVGERLAPLPVLAALRSERRRGWSAPTTSRTPCRRPRPAPSTPVCRAPRPTGSPTGTLRALVTTRHSAGLAGIAAHAVRRTTCSPVSRDARAPSTNWPPGVGDGLLRDLPVVHPRGRRPEPAAHRADPRRGLRRPRRRGDRGSRQLPVQRLPPGDAGPDRRRRHAGRLPARASGPTGSPGRGSPRWPSRTSTCRRPARRSDQASSSRKPIFIETWKWSTSPSRT